MERFRTVSELESLHQRIIAASSRVTLELPRIRKRGFLGFQYTDWKASAAEVCPGNNRIYGETLPQTVAVSNEIARYFAAQMSACNETEEKIWSATTKKQIWALISYVPNLLVAIYQANLFRGYDGLKAAYRFWEIHYDRLDEIEKLWSNLDLALWAYRLETDCDEFILRRGEWKVHTSTYTVRFPPRAGSFQKDTFQAAVMDVGLSAATRTALSTSVNGTALRLENPSPGIRGLTGTDWQPQRPGASL